MVDVGGGIGAQSLTLAQNYEHLQFVVQDRAEITKDAKEVCPLVFYVRPSASHNPFSVLECSHARRGQVGSSCPSRCTNPLPASPSQLIVSGAEHDFFTEQPVKDAAIFLLRNILHDWSDSYCLTILRRLRDAAAKTTRLMIVDNLISYACVDNELGTIRGAEKSLPPAPLLPNGGHSATIAYFQDIQVRLPALAFSSRLANCYSNVDHGLGERKGASNYADPSVDGADGLATGSGPPCRWVQHTEGDSHPSMN